MFALCFPPIDGVENFIRDQRVCAESTAHFALLFEASPYRFVFIETMNKLADVYYGIHGIRS